MLLPRELPAPALPGPAPRLGQSSEARATHCTPAEPRCSECHPGSFSSPQETHKIPGREGQKTCPKSLRGR